MGREFTEIDRQFNEAYERIQPHSSMVSNPYGAAPGAADHFLLKKSWDYFRGRVKSIEDQWRKMLDAKDQQLRAALQELQTARQRSVDVEEENRVLRSLEQNVKKARTEDFMGFSRKAENLRHHWDAERDALARKVEALEMKISQIKKAAELRLNTALIREEKLKEAVALLKQESFSRTERERELQKQSSELMANSDEQIHSLDSKVDIFRGEVDRRDQLIKQLQESIRTMEQDSRALTAYVAELQQAIKNKDFELLQRDTQQKISNQEKENLRAGWERERSEWRELWDRGRSLWDKKSA